VTWFRARRLAERIAVLLQAAQLIKFTPAVADARVGTRQRATMGLGFGICPAD
jgi:hypothetical protein